MVIGEKRGIFMFKIEIDKKRYLSFGVLAFAVSLLALVFAFSSKDVDTETYVKKSDSKIVKKVVNSKEESSALLQTSNVESKLTHAKDPKPVAPKAEENAVEEVVMTESVPVDQSQTATTVTTQQSVPVVQQTAAASAPAYPLNGNTAGAIGSDAAAQMAAATGVSQATWEAIIARESNGNPNVANASGASGLFQTMPGWGSTATVQDQVNSAIKAYNAQGMSAWGY